MTDLESKWMDELSAHVVELYIAMLGIIAGELSVDFPLIWKSKRTKDGTFEGSHFSLGIGTENDQIIVYTIPMSRWEECSFAHTLETRPKGDDATSSQVLSRVRNLYEASKQAWK